MRVSISYFLGDVELCITADVSTYYPARVGGPPEHCCPAEGGEVEITSVTIEGIDAIDLYEALDAKVQARIEDACFERAAECGFACGEDDHYED